MVRAADFHARAAITTYACISLFAMVGSVAGGRQDVRYPVQLSVSALR